MNSTERLYEMAVKAAFYNMDFCPGTGFYEVLDDNAIDPIVKEAQQMIDSLGVSIEPVDRYIFANMLWGMDRDTFDAELAEFENG